MKKLEKKLHLNRETVRRLEPLSGPEIAKAQGGIDWTGCMSECTECGALFVAH